MTVLLLQSGPGASSGSSGVFATLNSAGTDVVLSNGNLTATRSVSGTTATGACSTVAKTTGKYYFEYTRGSMNGGSDGVGVFISPANSYIDMSNGASCSTIFTNFGPGQIYSNSGAFAAIPGTPVVGDVIGVAVDLAAHRSWFRKNGGNWNNSGTADPATGVGGNTMTANPFVPSVCFANTGSVSGNSVTANFGQAAYANAMPSGFSNWPAV